MKKLSHLITYKCAIAWKNHILQLIQQLNAKDRS